MKAKSQEDFLKSAKELHKDLDFSETVYINNHTSVTVICPKHGKFTAMPKQLLKSSYQCPKCKKECVLENFKRRGNIIHNNKYDYSLIKTYKNNQTLLPIICHEKDEFGMEHGVFYQSAKNHLYGYGCKKCSQNYMDLSLFVKRSNKIHNGKYDYSNIKEYVNNTTPVPIICPVHNEFWQRPDIHLRGQGCPFCKESHLERIISNVLTEANIKFERQYRFKWLVNDKTNYQLPLDFYLPQYNIAIECQGEQHFIANYYKSKGIDYAEEHLKGVQHRDGRKKQLCKEHNIHLIYFIEKTFIKYLSNTDIFFNEEEKLIEYIKNYKILT